MNEKYDLVVIGGGPGGYVAALRAAQLGMKVACVEKEPALGGTCLRVGCIPSKAMLESSSLFTEAQQHMGAHGIRLNKVELDLPAMLDRKVQIVTGLTKGIDSLFQKAKITRHLGVGRLAQPGLVEVEKGQERLQLEARHIIIATGSKVAQLPGVALDGDRVGTSTEALSYSTVPAHLIVIGGGYIGLELGSVWRRLGSTVTVLEFLDRILPGTDTEIAAEALKIFKKQGFDFRLSTKVTSARAQGKKCIVECEGAKPLTADRVLLAVGRTPYTNGLGLEKLNIPLDEKGRIPVDEHFQTAAAGVYAVGDCIRGPMLAHKAEEEGIACVEYLAKGYGHVNYDVIPSVVYTHPEIAAVGQTEEQLQQAKIPYRKGTFPFRANSRARTLGDTDGVVKILAHRDTDRILGVHILGNRAGELIAEAAAAMEFGASSEDLARTCHAHPTLSEAVKEAALAVDNRSLSI